MKGEIFLPFADGDAPVERRRLSRPITVSLIVLSLLSCSYFFSRQGSHPFGHGFHHGGEHGHECEGFHGPPPPHFNGPPPPPPFDGHFPPPPPHFRHHGHEDGMPPPPPPFFGSDDASHWHMPPPPPRPWWKFWAPPPPPPHSHHHGHKSVFLLLWDSLVADSNIQNICTVVICSSLAMQRIMPSKSVHSTLSRRKKIAMSTSLVCFSLFILMQMCRG